MSTEHEEPGSLTDEHDEHPFDRLFPLVDDAVLFYTPREEAGLTLQEHDRELTLLIKSPEFCQWFLGKYQERYGKQPDPTYVGSFLRVLEEEALLTGTLRTEPLNPEEDTALVQAVLEIVRDIPYTWSANGSTLMDVFSVLLPADCRSCLSSPETLGRRLLALKPVLAEYRIDVRVYWPYDDTWNLVLDKYVLGRGRQAVHGEEQEENPIFAEINKWLDEYHRQEAACARGLIAR